MIDFDETDIFDGLYADGRLTGDDYDDDPICEDCDDYVSQCSCGEWNPMDGDSDGYRIDGVGFADPGGNSSLRAATRNNPRNLPCPTCGQPDRLTPIDVARHYQCDSCADAAEWSAY